MEARRPWSPDPAWADPLIAALALLCLLCSALVLRQRSLAPATPAEGPSIQGRILEVALGARLALGPGTVRGAASPPKDLPSPSDRAIVAVLLAEEGRPADGRQLLTASPRPSEALLEAFECAYGQGAVEPRVEALKSDLGDGLAWRLLKARLEPPASREASRKAILQAWMQRFAFLAAAGLGVTALTLAGLATGIWLLASKAPWPPTPQWSMSGRALLLVLLGWFTAYFLSALLAQTLAALWPPLRPFAIPLSYALHAATGVALLCKAEGLGLRDLRQRLFPGDAVRSLALAPAFVGLGLGAVLAGGLLLAPLLRGHGHPQQELIENLRRVKGTAPVACLFLTVAVIAPCFEELLMRGLLLGWLRSRRGPALALAASALVFGAIHLQILALPTLSLLGAAFGLGVMRSGDLRTGMLAHGLWNGSLFVLLRLLM